jgi:hypothetical protein
LAKAQGIPAIAANAPRRTAAAVAMADAISSEVVGKNSITLPRILHFDSDEHFKHLAAQMKIMPPSVPMKGYKVEALYKAQVLKDAVMAASLEPFLKQRIFFCCGRFHSDGLMSRQYPATLARETSWRPAPLFGQEYLSGWTPGWGAH